MDDVAVTEDLVYDLVDNWRDEYRTKYIAFNLVHLLQADNRNVLAILGNKTVLLNLFSVIFEVIMKYDFRTLYVRVFNILMGATHSNSMFLFQHITSKKGHYIYEILRMSLDNNDVALLRESTEVRKKAGKQAQFRIAFEDVNKTGYGRLANGKITLYRDYFSRQNLNIEICVLIFSDLLASLTGQPALKHTFCMNSGWVQFMNVFNNPCFKTSETIISAFPAWCNVISTLLETNDLGSSPIPSYNAEQILKSMKGVIENFKCNVPAVEAALPVVMKSMNLLKRSDDNLEIRKFFSNAMSELKSLHSESMTIYQNCTIVEMLIAIDGPSTAKAESPTSRTESRSSRSRIRTEAESKKSRTLATRDKTVVTPPRSYH